MQCWGLKSWIAHVLAAICLLSPAACEGAQVAQESFAEEAVVVPLSNGLVLVRVHFTLQATHKRHYTLFPKAVGQLAAAIPFNGLELSLTQGRWHYQQWGEPLLQAKPAGAELRAAFSPLLPADALGGLWGNLSHALGGLFCSSLNFVARPEATAQQAISMQQRPPAQHPQQQEEQEREAYDPKQQRQRAHRDSWVPRGARQHVLYAALPQEASCTENLTPWLKLLPCRDAAGIGRLLSQRDVLFRADYHSLQVSVDVQRDKELNPQHVTLTQSFDMVLRVPQDAAGSLSNAATRPPKSGTLSDIDLAQLLGGQVSAAACPVARISRLYVRLPEPLTHQQWSIQLPAFLEAGGGSTQSSLQDNQDGGSHPSTADDQVDGPASDTGRPTQGHFTPHENDGKGDSVWANRAASWQTPAFTLQPAPDAAVVLQPVLRPPPRSLTQSQQQMPATTGDDMREPAPLHVLYMFDQASNTVQAVQQGRRDSAPPAAGGQAAAGTPAPFSLSWRHEAPEAAAAASAWSPLHAAAAGAAVGPRFAVSRYITGTGNLHGGMVLQLQAAAASSALGSAAQPGDGLNIFAPNRNLSVCIVQMVPWYIRLWLHTLKLSINGQPASLEDHMLLMYISPAEDRKKPLVLDLCLAVPVSTYSIVLTAQFTKAFLMMLEHPPDAHRGFDVPPVIITVGCAAVAPCGGSGNASDCSAGNAVCSCAGSDDACASPVSWQVVQAAGSESARGLDQVTPLMWQLKQTRPCQVYSPGLVVPLAVPDFSMPYNVICLTSTVLAVFVGGVLNALLWRPGKEEREAADADKVQQRRRKKVVRLAALVLLFGGVAVYWDPELQAEILAQLTALGVVAAPTAQGS